MEQKDNTMIFYQWAKYIIDKGIINVGKEAKTVVTVSLGLWMGNIWVQMGKTLKEIFDLYQGQSK